MSDCTPECVSVYQYHDKAGVLLYVGVTSRNVRRAQEHAETKAWWPLTTGCAIEHFDSREAALNREAELIRRYKPPFNTVHNDMKQEAQDHYLHRALTRAGNSPAKSLKRRRQEWYAMSPEARRTTPCVRCGERPNSGRGPECVLCHPSRLSTDGSRTAN